MAMLGASYHFHLKVRWENVLFFQLAQFDGVKASQRQFRHLRHRLSELDSLKFLVSIGQNNVLIRYNRLHLVVTLANFQVKEVVCAIWLSNSMLILFS